MNRSPRSPGAGQMLPPPSELSGALPRDVRLTGGGVAAAVAAIAMAVGAVASAIIMSVAYARAEEHRELREREGTFVEAKIVRVARTSDGQPRTSVAYRFAIDGRSYTGRTTLRDRDRRKFIEGGPMPIGYIRSRPDVSWPVGYEPGGFPPLAIPLGFAGLLAGAAALARSVRRQYVLLSEGRVATARITGLKKFRGGGHSADKRYHVSCEFKTLSGARRAARCDVGRHPPVVGASIAIVYHRDDPEWNALYPLQLVRLSRARPSR